KALPEPKRQRALASDAYIAPSNDLEKQLAAIWGDILGQEKIGTNENFFALGGDSITANQAVARIRKECYVNLPLRTLFENPFVSDIAKELKHYKRQEQGIPRFQRKGKIPLTFAQERLMFLQQLDENSMAYYVPRVVGIKVSLDIKILENTFSYIIRRHEILRTVFPYKDGEFQQVIRPPFQLKIRVIDFSETGEPQQAAEVKEWLFEEGRRAFDFDNGPMMRITVLKLSELKHLLVLTEHHLIHDGWTMGVLLKEFVKVFTTYWRKEEPQLPELPIQYADYALWQRRQFTDDVLERHLAYWKEKLSGLPALLELPVDRPRPAVISGRGDMKIVVVPENLTHKLAEFGRQRGVTLYMTMMAVFRVLLYLFSGVEDLCVGAGAANRKYKELESMLGMVINTLALRTPIDGDATFDEFLLKVKNTCLEAYQYEDTPFDKVVDVVQPERSLSYTPIFQVIFSFMDTPVTPDGPATRGGAVGGILTFYLYGINYFILSSSKIFLADTPRFCYRDKLGLLINSYLLQTQNQRNLTRQ
ncbi:MAG: hypothetical protein GY757_56295, partial [bacterium]|nr:hypothetical protein [bacterium]